VIKLKRVYERPSRADGRRVLDPARWSEFKRRYRAELRTSERRELLETLADQARRDTVTLVYAARDEERNSARVVREELAKMGR